jgi:hypothetical protein
VAESEHGGHALIDLLQKSMMFLCSRRRVQDVSAFYDILTFRCEMDDETSLVYDLAHVVVASPALGLGLEARNAMAATGDLYES